MDARLELGACSSAVVSHTPTVVRDFAVETRWPAFTAEVVALGLRGCFTTPILSSDQSVLGTFAIYYREPGDPTPHDQRLVDLVTSTVALAIERQQADEALRASEQRLADDADALARLNELSSQLWRMSSLREGLDEMLAAVIELLGADMGNVQILDPDRRLLAIAAQRGFKQDFLDYFNSVHEGTAACGVALQRRERVIVEDVRTDPAFAEHQAIVASAGYRAVQSTPLIGRDGTPLGMLSTHFRSVHWLGEQELARLDLYVHQAADFIERVRTEEALRESEERFRTLADNMSQLAWTCDRLGAVTWYNQRWLDYTGMTFEEMQGWGWRTVQHPDHVDRVVQRVEHSRDTGEIWEDTFPLRGRDGSYRWFLSRALPIRDEQGNIVRWFGTNTDVTEQREMEYQIKQQAEQLADESRRKDEFLAMLSHELRNPLAPISSAVHLLRMHERGSENAIQQQAREIIERQVGNLTKLVSDLLEVSRVVSGRIRLNLQTVDLNQIVRHAIETAKPLIEQRRHELVTHPCDEPLWSNVDPTRLEEVIINLLNNAAKYTPDGGRIEVWCERPRGENAVLVRVRDNGTGIDQELLPRIFDLFTQADRSLARSAGGLGIGLSLAHRLVDLHGGTIEAHSPPEGSDVGSEFIVKLPLMAAPPELGQPEAPTAESPQDPGGVRVLVVDDNIDLVMMLASTLRKNGYSVQSAYTGPEGLKVAQQWRPDVVLLDIGLPGLDGYEVARRLRGDPTLGNAGAQMRLIALTGYGRDTDIALASEAGFDAHLVKPYEFDELEKLMTPQSQPRQ